MLPRDDARQRAGEPDGALGPTLRRARRERGMTLVQLAAAAGLSQPFLSQLELGRARPSMRSLWRIAEALGTTQQALLAGEPDPVPVDAGGAARLLLHDPEGADVTEFVGAPTEWGEFFTHGRTELLYVVAGRFEVELEGSPVVSLDRCGSISYPGTTPHRFRQVGTTTGIVLVVHGG
ncbi:XRE family transcriptional regulator [Actinomycetospora sp. NBRC 106378]|uniref:helix-turn-helix domain-containing protein n=1 Tax=Actinomycetospora sp. NBRC 106378 TaxID=3032208 RepID=UPI002552D039|nr:XRE family transcriptional regulator [Actinomycetospora sp. NBRC 106378]